MMDKRLVYWVIIKALFLLLIIALAIVLINSLFTQSNDENINSTPSSIIELVVTGMQKGEIRKTQWEGKDINIINLGNNEYFTYINIGDSGNCPLFKENNGFKDVCTGTKFNFSGEQKDNVKHGFRLRTPPSFYKDGIMYIGTKVKNK